MSSTVHTEIVTGLAEYHNAAAAEKIRASRPTPGKTINMSSVITSLIARPRSCRRTCCSQAKTSGPPVRARTSGASLPPFVLVAPATEPSVTAPLGWTLSQASIRNLLSAIEMQAGSACTHPLANGQAPRLCDLAATLLKPDK